VCCAPCVQALGRVKARVLESVVGPVARAVALDLQARALVEGVGRAVEAALVNPGTSIRTPWVAVAETYAQLGHDAMSVDAALVPTVHVSIPLPFSSLVPAPPVICHSPVIALFLVTVPSPCVSLPPLDCFSPSLKFSLSCGRVHRRRTWTQPWTWCRTSSRACAADFSFCRTMTCGARAARRPGRQAPAAPGPCQEPRCVPILGPCVASL